MDSEEGWGWYMWSRKKPPPQEDTQGNADANANTNTHIETHDNTNEEETALENQERWYHQVWNKIPSFKREDEADFVNNINFKSHLDLNAKQIDILRNEVQTNVNNNNLCNNTWVWYKAYNPLSKNSQDSEGEFHNDTDGIVSMMNTGSSRIPIPFQTYPFPTNQNAIGNKIYIKKSLILPSSSPSDYMHELPKQTKFANSFKNYYNYPHENHLYIKSAAFDKESKLIKDKEKILIISLVGNLPEHYEKSSIGYQRNSNYLSCKLANSLIDKNKNCQIETLSFQSPLNLIDLNEALQQCISLLKNYENLFKEVQSIFFVGIYHSIPLLIVLATHILKRHNVLDFNKQTNVGILAFESNLEGYRFWDHNSDLKQNEDTTSNKNTATNESNNISEQDKENNEEILFSEDYNKIQQQREKQLFQYASKREQEVLQNIRSYRKLNSIESLYLQKNLDWLLYNWKPFRLTLFGKLYDNFMTVSQKLALDFIHPKIIRNIWCDGKYLDINTKFPQNVFEEDVHLKSLQFDSKIKLPKKRLFEIELINDLLLLTNLGYNDFLPFFKSISPFFISRSFNDNTLPPTVAKKLNTEQKAWLSEMNDKFKITTNNTTNIPIDKTKQDNANNNNHDLYSLPLEVSSLFQFLEYCYYEDIKSNGLLKIFDSIYDDDEVYKCFIENTLNTRAPLFQKHLTLSNDHSTPKSIFRIMNQYDLVWKLHEALSEFLTIKNLPQQERQVEKLKFFISVNLFNSFETSMMTKDENKKIFDRSNRESQTRISNLWKAYRDWDPQTTGLKQLKNIMSVFLLYNNPQQLINDLSKK
ncbi:hypothetical protein TPHA_0C03710 [Tetrapisispora phaffii CBS 4417]|uniref:Uncharacterized protein n=1 Tax=Tetrapisispora phaffii (strain ATCC 24235 / CBS 4417 / NBRC 1672 / NRRL Y-8282 / UCD 70-5) TaxID=1071381 RepID=G8BQL1_TETPH|nr:hypothetical protein TPHA_0C03710 [Tetrapisispora phaffii CBS 4417]CCE62523.1 hypothetical protein TPHA_0C03710 [Tetrapisispora phaffii CBS 4417]